MNLFRDYEKIGELEQEIESRTSDGEWIFRGESEFNDQVSSSLYRKCIKLPRTNESNVHKTMELVEGRMQVESRGYLVQSYIKVYRLQRLIGNFTF